MYSKELTQTRALIFRILTNYYMGNTIMSFASVYLGILSLLEIKDTVVFYYIYMKPAVDLDSESYPNVSYIMTGLILVF